MFTGLVQETARVKDLTLLPEAKGSRLEIESCLEEVKKIPSGASVAINGACLTMVDRQITEDLLASILVFEVSPETLARTNLGGLSAGSFVHLELPLNLGSHLGGHLVSGHVDAMAVVSQTEKVGDYLSVMIRLEGDARVKVAPFIVEKGSITLDGVSLTVNRVNDLKQTTEFEIMLIPHTLAVTWPEGLFVGRKLNIEADLLAKHFVRYQSFTQSVAAQNERASHVELES